MGVLPDRNAAASVHNTVDMTGEDNGRVVTELGTAAADVQLDGVVSRRWAKSSGMDTAADGPGATTAETIVVEDLPEGFVPL